MVNALVRFSSLIVPALIFCQIQSVFGQEIGSIDDPRSDKYGVVQVWLGKDKLDLLRSEKLSPSDISSFFYVQVHAGINMLGSYELTDTSLLFIPRFLPDPDLPHLAYFDPNIFAQQLHQPSTSNERKVMTLHFPREAAEQTKVTHFYPALDTLPANLLRAYVYFSSSMGLGDPLDFIELTDSNGGAVKGAFVDIASGLWNEDRTRLTLFFHPGRIKRGVGPNMTSGAILTNGQTYTLKIASEWRDNAGTMLAENFKKQFFVGPSIRERIHLDRWKVAAPKARSNEVLVITTQSSLDFALTGRMLQVLDKEEKIIDGHWELSEKVLWKFIPASPWLSQTYSLKASSKLEDISGNSIESVFDEGSLDKDDQARITTLHFTVEDFP